MNRTTKQNYENCNRIVYWHTLEPQQQQQNVEEKQCGHKMLNAN